MSAPSTPTRRGRQAVYYSGYRPGHLGPKDDAGATAAGIAAAHHRGLEHMAFQGVQGRGVLVDLAHHLGHDFRGVRRDTLEEIMAADNVVVEPGDMLLLHTGFATKVLEWNREPDPVAIQRMCTWLDAAIRRCWMDHRLTDLGTVATTTCGRRTGREEAEEHSLLPIHHLPSSGSASRFGEMWYLHACGLASTTGAGSCHGPPLRMPGSGGCLATV
jgi:hypothetical protein